MESEILAILNKVKKNKIGVEEANRQICEDIVQPMLKTLINVIKDHEYNEANT